jgi:hypothetical protein
MRISQLSWMMVAVFLTLTSAGSAQVCPDGLTEGWDSGTTEGWVGLLSTSLTAHATGGNPAGYLEMTPASSQTAMQYFGVPWGGSWSAQGFYSFEIDLRFDTVAAGNSLLRLRPDASSSGWYYTIAASGPADLAWHHYRIDFDPHWSNAEAEAAGWYAPGGSDPGFAETMAAVDYVEIWVTTTGSVSVDNLSLGCLEPHCSVGDREGWDDSDLGGWVGASSTSVVVHDTAGVPDGWVEMTPSSNQVILQTATSPWSGHWSDLGPGALVMDMKFLGGAASSPRVRLRANAGLPGWWFTLASIGDNDGYWHRFEAPFDPTWTDVQAEAAGWSFGGVDEISFAGTLESVGYLEIWAGTMGTVGVDNFTRCIDPLFVDGFESGDTLEWSSSNP